MSLSSIVPARAWDWYQTPDGRKMVRYSMVSVVAVPVGLLGLAIGLEVFGMSPGWAGVFGACVGAVPSYYLNRSWVWGKTGKSHLMKEIVPFWLISLVGVLFSGWIEALAGHWTKAHGIEGLARLVLLLAANVAGFGVLWAAKYMLFNKVLFVVQHAHDAQPHTHAEEIEAGLAGAAGAPEL